MKQTEGIIKMTTTPSGKYYIYVVAFHNNELIKVEISKDEYFKIKPIWELEKYDN